MLLAKDRLPQLLDHLAAQARVYVPARVGEDTRFALYSSGLEPDFEMVNTSLPPKDLLFPQAQSMYRYGFDDNGTPFIDPVHDSDNTVLFGVRPCDVQSIACMDDVFLTMGYEDEFYAPKREKLLIVALVCNNVAESCFCDSMGLDPNSAPYADIQLRQGSEGFEIVAQTEKGQAALSDWKSFLSDGTATRDNVSCTLKVDMTGIKDKLDEMYEHPIWDRISKKCLTCGTCTYVCPTCHCFDISQENRMKLGERFRSWDSCMFSNYTEMAGHHNPRAGKQPRVRQRFLHKLCFFEDRYGKTLCVGCGRCVEKCPVALDITVLIDQIGAADVAEGAEVLEGAAHGN
ncbi:MAG: 4Fe-4S dicluster domain-containing protein [Coriobacteriales bacterium]|jgi:ferredoxin|nr:4Fe-4S dicluster domain-containing protein [Coriobacteriales bacterium]